MHIVSHKISETNPVPKLFWIRPLEPNPHEPVFHLTRNLGGPII
jgi:hypothetical protein